MGEFTMTPGGEYEWMVSYSYVAEWKYQDAVASTDVEATAFGPRPWALREGLIRATPWAGGYQIAPGVYANKPVVYLPVKRRNGEDVHPKLILSIQLVAPQWTNQLKVKVWAGTAVEIDVVNVLQEKSGAAEAKLTLYGKLDKDLACRIEVNPKVVESWLAAKSPLKSVVNDNLLDFRFKLTGVMDDGRPVVGQSKNRLFLYCRKTVVFLPGLFASQVQFKTADGETVGFPDFWSERLIEKSDLFWKLLPGGINWPSVVPDMHFQRVNVLECDDKGAPLLPCPKPTLLMLHSFRYAGYNVINPFTSLHNARVALLPHVPERFRLYSLIIYPYDWRCDLTDAAAALIKHLAELKNGPAGSALSKAPDTDDQVVVMGHSTGGVVIRRALAPIKPDDCSPALDPKIKNFARPTADSLIRFAFFLSVPFAGAPKAAAVLLTGLEAPEGERQIPFLRPESLVAVSLSMPIVYHLHTSTAYAHRPSTSPSRPPGLTLNAEADKAAFVKDALAAGLMPRPWLVKAELATSPEHRVRLALGAQQWHELVAELHERNSGHNVKYAIQEPWALVNWFETEVRKRNLQWQKDVRLPSEWNGYLAARAKAFHDISKSAITGLWKDRSCIMWGSCANTPTLRQLNLSKVGTRTYDDTMAFLKARGILMADIGGTTSTPRVREFELETPDKKKKLAKGGRKDLDQWVLDGKKLVETTWRLAWVMQFSAGDGTVPSDSQLAESKAVHANLLTNHGGEAPKHMDSTKSADVWRALVASIHAGAIVASNDDEKAAVTKNFPLPGTSGAADLPFYVPEP